MHRHLFVYPLALLLTLTGCDSLPGWMGGVKKKIEPLPGERTAVIPTRAGALKADPSLQGAGFAMPEVQPCAEWPQHGGNLASAPVHCALPQDISVRGSATVGGGEAFERGTAIPPVTGDGKVFVMDAGGSISAHAARKVDTVHWKVPGVADKEGQAMLGGGLAYANGILYAVSGRGLAAAFDAGNGRELWRHAINTPVRAAPKAASGMLFVVTADSQTLALDARSGDVRWSHRGINEGASFLAYASPSLARDLVAAPYASGEIYVLDAATGKELWNDTLSPPKRTEATALFTGIGGDPVIVGNALYAVSSAGFLGAYRFDNGSRVWEREVASVDMPWVAGDRVFLLSTDDVLMALNRMDGRVYWSLPLPRYEDEKEHKGRYSWSGPILAGEKLYVVGAHGQMRVFSPETGAEERQVEIPEGVYTAPILAGETMYLMTQDAKLTALY